MVALLVFYHNTSVFFEGRQLHGGQVCACWSVNCCRFVLISKHRAILEGRMNRLKVYKNKRYTHFDTKRGIEAVRNLVENPKWVTHHGFYPFIHYEIKTVKYNGIKRKDKSRHIYYSAHIDRYIYALYAYKINSLYNGRTKKDCINQCAIAYRNCLHKNNIDFAKEVFDFVRKTNYKKST